MSIINKISERLQQAKRKNAKDIRITLEEAESIILLTTTTFEKQNELAMKVIELQNELVNKKTSLDDITVVGDGGSF